MDDEVNDFDSALFRRDCSVAKSLHCSMDLTRGCQSSWEFLGILSLNSLNEII